MATDETNETGFEITYEERIDANRALSADLTAGGVKNQFWTTPARGDFDPGTGVGVFDGVRQVAQITIDGKGMLRVRKVIKGIMDRTEFLKKLIEVTRDEEGYGRLTLADFIPSKNVKEVDSFGASAYGKRLPL